VRRPTSAVGLYGEYTEYENEYKTIASKWQVMVMLEVYLAINQVIFLNLIISILSDVRDRVSQLSHLVTAYERAKIVLNAERIASETAGLRGERHLHIQVSCTQGSAVVASARHGVPTIPVHPCGVPSAVSVG
jgi:hypothetical protein